MYAAFRRSSSLPRGSLTPPFHAIPHTPRSLGASGYKDAGGSEQSRLFDRTSCCAVPNLYYKGIQGFKDLNSA